MEGRIVYTLVVHPPFRRHPLIIDGLSIEGAARWYRALRGRWVLSFELDSPEHS